MHPEEKGTDSYFRRISLTIWTVDSEVRLNVAGERDWVTSVGAAVGVLLQKNPRTVWPWRLGLTVGFVFGALGVITLASRDLPDNDSLDPVFSSAFTLTLVGGLLGVGLWTGNLLPPSRIALRGEAKDPLILTVFRDLVYLLVVGVVGGLIFSVTGLPH